MAKKLLLEIGLKNEKKDKEKNKKSKDSNSSGNKENNGGDEENNKKFGKSRLILTGIVLCICFFGIVQNFRQSTYNKEKQTRNTLPAALDSSWENSESLGNVFTPGPKGQTFTTELRTPKNSPIWNFMENKTLHSDTNSDSYKRDYIQHDNQTKNSFPEKLQVIRIATWNLYPLDFEKINSSVGANVSPPPYFQMKKQIDPETPSGKITPLSQSDNKEKTSNNENADKSKYKIADRIVDLLMEFDITAIQGIRARNYSVLDTIIYLIEKKGGNFDYITTPPSTENESQTAFIYNLNRIDAGHDTIKNYSVLSKSCRNILCASFRTNLVPPEKAFTFTLVNLDLSATKTIAERDFLFDLYKTIRDSGGGQGIAEDDVILLGNFNAPADQLGAIGQAANMAAIHLDKKTTLEGTAVDNILFDSKALAEYIERFGIVDLESFFEMSTKEAQTISTYRPVWADFSVLEGTR